MTYPLHCPCCGQLMRILRGGVYLSPIKAAIFDAVEARGEFGASMDELLALDVLQNRPKRPSKIGVKSHVWQINDALEDKRWRIVSIDRRYVLVRLPDASRETSGNSADLHHAAPE